MDHSMNKILIANRGEIAVRIIRTCQQLNIGTVAIYSDADRDALHVAMADQALHIGPAAPEQSYLDPQRVLDAALSSGAQAIHPGYGFLSENADFAARVIAAGLLWIGPPVAAMQTMASKIKARELASEQQVPVLPAYILEQEPTQPDLEAIGQLGLPLLLKASAGGGGIGMREVHDLADLPVALEEARAQALRQFGSAELLIERLLTGARHVEVQVLGDQHGKLLHFHDRDCSLQRRRQKLIEEAPAPGLLDTLRQQLHAAALRLARAVDYQGLGTVEFLVSGDEFFLLEMNTRLQVEHGVTEAVCNVDLVELQIRIAGGEALALEQSAVVATGHAIEARIYAEEPAKNFTPASGEVLSFSCTQQEHLRLDTGIASGSKVGHHYDGLLCKLISRGDNRAAATARLEASLRELCITGVSTNQRLLRALLRSSTWQNVAMHTACVEQQINDLLADSALTHAERDCALVAATLWQFREHPPSADHVAWPGAFKLSRNAGWLCEDIHQDLEWQWLSATEFGFTQLQQPVRLLQHKGGNSKELLIELNGSRRLFRFEQSATRLWVWEAELGAVMLTDEPVVGGPNVSVSGDCSSPGPGLVLRLLVEPGLWVEPGTPLVVLESMKMENTLCANRAGQVSTIVVAVGELVASGQHLIAIDTTAEQPA
jgi:acetyl/propionyl-CoA carboxylase alpha subunit